MTNSAKKVVESQHDDEEDIEIVRIPESKLDLFHNIDAKTIIAINWYLSNYYKESSYVSNFINH